MNLNSFVTILINRTPVQSMRINSTKVFIQLMEQEYNIPRDLIVDVEIDGDIYLKPQYYDKLNAFQHAYNSAKLSYDYGKNFAILLGDAKEIITWNSEPDIKDRNRDLWNNSIAAGYAETQKNNGISFEDIARNIFLDIMGENSSYITNLNDNETRHAYGSDNYGDLLEHIKDQIIDGIKIPESYRKSTDTTGMDKYLNDALNGNIHPDTIAPEGVTYDFE